MANPIYLKVVKTLDHPLDVVWNKVALNFGYVSEYNPAIQDSRYDSETKTGVGTKRYCKFAGKGGFIKEEIIDWQDNESFMLTFTETSAPMSVLKSKFHFKEINGKTELVQEFWFRMKAPMGWMSRMMKGKMRAVLVDGLNGLELSLNSK
ncbi:SRPBCC family protein [Roseivirga sp. E12]|uniref:SRPBCC family protein n=1 Tax=Roseivirga sp. E12 TaxID=2819237 RepID=UPI001ABCD5B9|nr:SRPBCC family protein [Roseivirga sp. E12]MBO3697452.1 SRPBCC family protein [Roseivirga sp. E12]